MEDGNLVEDVNQRVIKRLMNQSIKSILFFVRCREGGKEGEEAINSDIDMKVDPECI